MDRKKEILIRFGSRVRDLRLRKKYSQESFAEKCNLDRTYIGGIERGERNLTLLNIERIASALDVTISDLLAGL